MFREYCKFIKNYFKLYKVKKKYFIFMIVTALLYKLFEILNVLFAAWIIKYVTSGNYNMTWISLGLLVSSYLLYTLFYLLNNKVYGKNMNYCYTTLQTKLLNKMMGVDDNFTKHISKGKLLNSINKDVIHIGDTCDQISEFFTTILQTIVVWIIVLNYNVIAGLVMIGFSFIYLLIENYTDRKATIYFRKQKIYTDKYSGLFSQILTGMQEIKTFNMLPKLEDKLDTIKHGWSSSFFKKRKYIIVRDNDIRFLTHGTNIIIYIVLLLFMLKEKLPIEILVLITGYFESNLSNVDKFLSTAFSIREVNVSVERIQSILDYSERSISFGNVYNDNIDGIIEFDNVKFSYDEKEILKGLSFTIEKNKITAIVGQSGTGKTSIINLLLRLYKPDSGRIYIDGVDIYEYAKVVHKSNVSVVNQKPFIFNMSIRKNLDFVDTNIERQIEACKRVGIHDFIVQLPKGYNTVLRENANNISGGQKQLISLARTLLSKSEILLFDEVTSSLDPETAIKIHQILKELKKDHTIVLVTHKPELMANVDRLIVLHKGKIVADGTHKELLKESEHYRWLQARKSASKMGVFNND